jgi:hypothetical protein
MAWGTRDKINVGLGLAVLGASAAFMQAAQSKGWLSLVKQRLPILKPIKELNRTKLEPFMVVSSQEFPAEVTEELGTEEYFNWIIKEPSAAPYKGRIINLTATYYTGVVDQVPHVPEECMVQGAYTQAGDDVMQMELPTLGESIEVRRLQFYPPRDVTVKTYVYYTFCVNGDYLATRMAVRSRMTKFADTHLYYSKVEVAFRGRPDADLNELDARAREVMDRVLSELRSSHFPPKGWEQGGLPAVSSSSAPSPQNP